MSPRKLVVALITCVVFTATARAQECEPLHNMAIMYRHYACQKKVPWSLSFWVSDLSFLERQEQAEYSAACRQKNPPAYAYKPQGCSKVPRSPEDYAVIVHTFVSKKHFCNFRLPDVSKESTLRLFGGRVMEPDSAGLGHLRADRPSGYEHYYADLPPHGRAFVRCDSGGIACSMNFVSEDGEYFFEVSLPADALKEWRSILAKSRQVAARCI